MPQLIDNGLHSIIGTNSAIGVGWKLNVYRTGTSTRVASYPTEADAVAATNANANPVVLGSDGRLPPMWVNEAVKVVLTDASDVVKKTVDPISIAIDAADIPAATGGTVEDAIWHKGRATPIAGIKMAIRWLRDDATFPLENEAGIWPNKVVTDHGISASFGAADGQANSPCAGMFVLATNNGSPGDVCGMILSTVANTNNSTAFGLNVIARGTGKSGCKFVGMEIDIEPSATDTSPSSNSIGLAINVFSIPIPGPAVQTGTVSGGTFNNGIILGGLASGAAGLALQSAGQANSLVNTTVGTFTGVALTLGNGQSRGVKWTDGIKSTFSYFDGTNQRECLPLSGAWVFRNSADTASLVAIGDTGNGGFIDAQGASPEIRVGNVKIAGNRDTGWAAMTGTANKGTVYDTATVTLAQLAGRVASLQAALTAHGLIGV